MLAQVLPKKVAPEKKGRRTGPSLFQTETAQRLLFEDELELELELEFEDEFEELLDELFEDELDDEFELEFEELLDEPFEDEFELELPATRTRSPACCASTFAGAARSMTASLRCACAPTAPSVARAAPASAEIVTECFMTYLR